MYLFAKRISKDTKNETRTEICLENNVWDISISSLSTDQVLPKRQESLGIRIMGWKESS
jgi:hypothetical protein